MERGQSEIADIEWRSTTRKSRYRMEREEPGRADIEWRENNLKEQISNGEIQPERADIEGEVRSGFVIFRLVLKRIEKHEPQFKRCSGSKDLSFKTW